MEILLNDDKTFSPVVKGIKVESIRGIDRESVFCVTNMLLNEIERQREDEWNNYGLLFYAFGYDGKRQQEFAIDMLENYGVQVF